MIVWEQRGGRWTLFKTLWWQRLLELLSFPKDIGYFDVVLELDCLNGYTYNNLETKLTRYTYNNLGSLGYFCCKDAKIYTEITFL